MKHGERQVSPTIDGIRKDHVDRYKFVAKRLAKGSRVIDFACGIGYGTRTMAVAGAIAHGFDIDPEAIEYAKQHYIWHNTEFAVKDGNNPGDLGEYDVAVSFETIEHIEDPRPLLKALRAAAPVLYCSVPNEAVMPFSPEPGITTAYHFRHYTKKQFKALLAECGWGVDEWHGQEGPESDVHLDVDGRTLVAVCSRAEVVEQTEDDVAANDNDDLPIGKHVAIVALGPSVDQYLDLVKRQGGRSKFCDEVWAINALGNVFDCDLVFHMDDVRIQEIRAAANPDSNIAAMLRWIKTSRVPVVTSRIHSDYPALVEFPLEDVLNHLGHDYFNSTAAYAVAFAIHIGVSELSLFGMDFTYENTHHAEKGRACVEFWLGQAHARGIKIHLPKSTSLMDANTSRASRLYGYDTLDVQFHVEDDGHLKLNFKPRDTLPTAAEIEKNYDHSAPIAKQHLALKDAA